MQKAMPHLRRSRKTPLRSQVTAILRNAILSGRVKPGSILYERELAKQLGVSKTPVRESLTVLDHEGLVRTLPRKGYLVSGFTVQDVHNFFDLRVILESAAVELAVSRITDKQLETLTALVPDGTPDDDMLKRLDRNVDLHYSLALLSGNDRLASLVKTLMSEMRRMIAAGYVPEEHEKLMAALKERDPKRAAEAMRNHINAVRERALRLVPSPLANPEHSEGAPTEKPDP
jgi:DNA-binding GntR family transcriptional regulator